MTWDANIFSEKNFFACTCINISSKNTQKYVFAKMLHFLKWKKFFMWICANEHVSKSCDKKYSEILGVVKIVKKALFVISLCEQTWKQKLCGKYCKILSLAKIVKKNLQLPMSYWVSVQIMIFRAYCSGTYRSILRENDIFCFEFYRIHTKLDMVSHI